MVGELWVLLFMVFLIVTHLFPIGDFTYFIRYGEFHGLKSMYLRIKSSIFNY